jgi:hypothetical protein
VADEILWGDDPGPAHPHRDQGLLLNLPPGWAQHLLDFGADFSVSYAETTALTGRWQPAGALPEGVETGDVEFTGVVSVTGDAGTVTSDEDLLCAFDATGSNAHWARQQAVTETQEQHPDAGTIFQTWTNSTHYLGTITATVIDSCGAPHTRDFSFEVAFVAI